MTKPTIVCVPGAWHTPEIYDQTFRLLKQHGYETIGVPLPSVGAKVPEPNFDGDVKSIRDCLDKLIEGEGKDVVLVTHSYSGMPGTEAPRGLDKKGREAKGLKGGVIRLVYIQSLAMPENFCCLTPDAKMPYWMTAIEEKGIVIVTPKNCKDIFYNDISQAEADKWIAKVGTQSIGVYTSTTSYAAWKDIPSTYVTGLLDKSDFSPDFVAMIINNCKKENPDAFDVVETCKDGGHCLMISHPQFLADALRRSAGETV